MPGQAEQFAAETDLLRGRQDIAAVLLDGIKRNTKTARPLVRLRHLQRDPGEVQIDVAALAFSRLAPNALTARIHADAELTRLLQFIGTLLNVSPGCFRTQQTNLRTEFDRHRRSRHGTRIFLRIFGGIGATGDGQAMCIIENHRVTEGAAGAHGLGLVTGLVLQAFESCIFWLGALIGPV